MIKLLTSNITKFKLSTPTIAKTVARLQYIGYEAKEEECYKVDCMQPNTGGVVNWRSIIEQATISHTRGRILFKRQIK